MSHLLSRDSQLLNLGNLLTLMSGFLIIPILIRNYGLSTWSSIVLAQTFGLVASFIIDLGYGFSGSSIAGTTPKPKRSELYLDSLIARFQISLILIPIMIAIYSILYSFTSHAFLIILFASAIQNFASAWIWQAEQKPALYLRFITVPRIVANLLGGVMTFASRDIALFALIQLIGQLTSILAVLVYLHRFHREKGEFILTRFFVPKLGLISARFRMLYFSLSYYLALNLPVLIVAVGELQETKMASVFILLDRVSKYTLNIFSPIVQYLQSRLPTTNVVLLKIRLEKAMQSLSFFGFAMSLLLTPLIPIAVRYLTSSSENIELELSFMVSLMTVNYLMLSILSSVGIVVTNQYSTVSHKSLLIVGATLLLLYPMASLLNLFFVFAILCFGLISLNLYYLKSIWQWL